MNNYNLRHFYDYYAYRLRASPRFKLMSKGWDKSVVFFDVFNAVLCIWEHYCLVRTSERYYRLYDDKADVVNVFVNCQTLFDFIYRRVNQICK